MEPENYIIREEKYGAHNHHPLSVVLRRDEDVFAWDVEEKCYFDFLSGHFILSQGHYHPKIMKALTEQAEKLTLVSRIFHANTLGEYMEFTCKLFGHDKLLPMNTGAKAAETVLKLCRRWGYRRKEAAPECAKIVVCNENFHKRMITIISMSIDSSPYADFGPYMSGSIKILYSHVDVLAEALKNPDVVGFLMEPIQGEVGVVAPDDGCLQACYDLYHQHNVLSIVDEIRTDIGHTGKLSACDYEGIRPDVLVLGKVLSGGVSPISAVLADDKTVLTIAPRGHGSACGGNPLAAKATVAALEVIRDKCSSENVFKVDESFRSEIEKIDNSMTKEVRDKGLLDAVVAEPEDGETAWDICLALKENGSVTKPAYDHTIRFAPPLVITEEQMMETISVIRDTSAKF